jgi:hypothetical protein
MVFELRDPDEQGRWYFFLTSDVHITFTKDDSDKVTGMTMVNEPRIPKQKQEDQELSHIPAELQTYCGTYPIPGQGEITVFYRNKHLAIKLPPSHVFDLEGPDEEERWHLRGESDQFSFVKDEEGNVRAIIIHEIIPLTKIED